MLNSNSTINHGIQKTIQSKDYLLVFIIHL